MTARTSWCSLWKPSLQRGTELLKYQTQRWIPLQTCSLFFTVGLCLCGSGCTQLITTGSPPVLCCVFTPRSPCLVFLVSFCLAPPFKCFQQCTLYCRQTLTTITLACWLGSLTLCLICEQVVLQLNHCSENGRSTLAGSPAFYA